MITLKSVKKSIRSPSLYIHDKDITEDCCNFIHRNMTNRVKIFHVMNAILIAIDDDSGTYNSG